MTTRPDVADHPVRILIVDDEPRNRRLLEVMLSQEGFVLETAAGGVEALAAVSTQRPDLILLDVVMRGMDGYEVARRIKADAATKNIPIIMVTVRDDREAKMRGLEAGAEDFLSKPIDRAELRVRVRNLLRLKAYGDYHDTYSQMLESEVGSRAAHLVETEARFRGLWDSGLILIAISDKLGTIRDVNEAGAALLGYSRDELLSGAIRWQDLTAVESMTAEAIALRQLQDRGVAVPYEKELLRKDGTRVPTLTGAAMLVGAEGITIAIDLTQRKSAENANLERMRIAELTAQVGAALTDGGALDVVLQRCVDAIIEHTPAACARIWTCDVRTKALVLSAAAGQCEGASDGGSTAPSEVIRIAHERAAHVTNDARSDSWLAGAAWGDGAGMTAFAGYPLLVSGELMGVLKIFANVPLTEAATNGFASIANAIAIGVHRSVGESIRVSLEGQLRQAQKMEAVGRLAGGVAHDFNNLLSVILSYADLMLDTLKSEDPMCEDLHEIRKAGERAADLTRQLLMFSRQQVLAPKVLDLDDLLTRMDKMLQRILGEDVELVLVAGAHLGRVRADPTSIEQIVMNLVVNARDAMPKGGRLTVETSNVDLDEEFARHHVDASTGPHVLLTVTDTGIGMDAVTQTRIFEPFFTTKSQDKGTGLGLSTVFGIAKQSGGSVWVDSVPGEGTTFRVYLPRVDRALDDARLVVPSKLRRGTETILLVDDNEQVRLVAREILRKNGYHVIDAKHAGEALLYCEQHPSPIHLLLTDVVMPQMSGPELAKRLAKDRPSMRVMCMSGYTDDSVFRHGLEGTEIAYLQKPITPDSLTRKVREVLDAAVAPRVAPAVTPS